MMNYSRAKQLFFGLVLLSSLLMVVGGVAAQEEPGDVVPTECTFEGYDLGLTTLTGEALGFECGYVVVPERHANPDGPTIRIPYAIRRATSNDARPDPLVVAQGGPGGDAFKIFTLLVSSSSLAVDRDVIIFNQRGTPYAEPELTCPETDDVLAEMLAASNEEGTRIYNEALAACHARLLAEGIDLSAYNSLENAADIPVLVRALGYDEYNFYGVSYGTLLGLHLMRNHPEGLRAVVLDSVVAPEINFISASGASEDRVLREVFLACESDPDCRQEYPNLEERFFALFRRLNENPVYLTITDPETGDDYRAFFDGEGFRALTFQLLYSPGMNAVLPKMVADLEKGDTRYVQLMWPLLVFDQNIAEGMYYSVICAEDADVDPGAVPLDALYPEIAESIGEDLQGFVNSCNLWPVEPLDPSVDDPVISDIPTLLFSGRFDPVTPPAFAESVAAGLSHATNLVDPAAAHGGVFFSPCSTSIVAAFLDDPTTPPDASCFLDLAPLTFVPPDAIFVPLLAGVNNLNVQTLTFFAVAGFSLLISLSAFFIWPIVYIVRAFRKGQPSRSPGDRRVRLLSRLVALAFGGLAFVFVVGLASFIVYALAVDQSLLMAMSLPPSAASILWIPIVLLALTVGLVIAATVLWLRAGSGSKAGKVYYTVIALAAVGFIIALATQGLLLPPL
ncbi:MAG: alpha/beta hydrolase [Anaerolineae bacterium]|nr:alpha/beta hydrolase [Anaerolineae bacterium]